MNRSLRVATRLTILACASTLPAQTRPRVSPLPRPATATPAQRAPAVAPLTMFVSDAFFTGMRYRSVGPARGGRVTTVTGVPSEPLTFYMGSTGGGVWKTTDAGQTWVNVTDKYFDVGSMGAIDVADSDPNIIYAGTGSDALRSNVSIGKGVYRSLDAGKTWLHVGLPNVGNIGGIRVHPTNPQIVFVAAIGNPFKPNPDRGVYRTGDGGLSWQKVLYVSDSTGAVDVEFQPGNPSTVYASMWRAERKPWTIISGAFEGGVYRSTDGGTSWRKLTHGLPNDLVGKSNIAVTPADSNVVYVLIEAKPGGGLYRSDDAGENFRLVSDYPPLITRPFYYTTITVDPRDANVVWVGTEGLYKSTDGGHTWVPQHNPHGDNHDLWINPRATDIMIQSNDGGAIVTLNGGRTWSTQYNQPTAEIYAVAADQQFPYRLYGAQQDNSTVIVPSLPLSSGSPDSPLQEWRAGPGCETGPIIPHPTNPDTVYGSCKGQFSRMSLRAGQEKQYWVGAQSLYGNAGKDLVFRFQRVSPMEISPFDPRVIYYGSQYVHRTRDEGVTWDKISPDLTWNPPERQQKPSGEPITIDVTGEEYYSVIYAIRESPLEPGVIWTGANDGPFYVTRDNGRTWTNVTPKEQPPGCRVQNIEPSPHRKGSAYYAVLCYLLGDFRPYLWRTDDYGVSWTRLATGSNGIAADEPTRVVREDPDREGLLYAGTEFGIYVSFDNGGSWRPFQLNLPHTPVTDLKVWKQDLLVSTQGRSFWILDDLTPLHQMSDAIAHASAHLFQPRAAYRVRYAGTFGGAVPAAPGPADPEYPPPGAAIDYWLSPDAAQGSVTLGIYDPSGHLLRDFSSLGAGLGERAPGSRDQHAGPSGAVSAPLEHAALGAAALPHTSGVNRFIWDLALAGAWDASPSRAGKDGPLVVPGEYLIRLSTPGYSAERTVTIKEDPRAVRDGVTLTDLREQFDHSVRVRDMASEVNELVDRVDAARNRLGQGGSPGGAVADTLARLNALRAKLVTPAVRYSKPELQAHIAYLYSMTMSADQKIGRDAVERYRQLRAELDERLKEAAAILGAGAAKVIP
jgi:photosystem II stability/assembly factor-like uncharacterized protein